MPAEDELDVRTPVRVSLIKDDLVAGCERVPVIAVLGVAFLFIVSLHTLFTTIIGVVLIVVAFPVLRYLAKRDPLFTRIMLRHFRYRAEYDAQTSLGRKPPLFPQR